MLDWDYVCAMCVTHSHVICWVGDRIIIILCGQNCWRQGRVRSWSPVMKSRFSHILPFITRGGVGEEVAGVLLLTFPDDPNTSVVDIVTRGKNTCWGSSLPVATATITQWSPCLSSQAMQHWPPFFWTNVGEPLQNSRRSKLLGI